MPSGFSNPFAIPQVRPNIGWDSRNQGTGLAMLIKTQEAIAKQRLMEARIAAAQARAAGGGGGGGGGVQRIDRYTDVIELPKADGTVEKVAVQAPTQKERILKKEQMLAERRQQIIDNDPEMQKLRSGFDKMSLPAQKEALDKMRQSATPRLAKVLNMSGEELTKSLVQPLQTQYEARNKEVNSSDFLGTLGRMAGSIKDSVSSAIQSFTDSESEMVKRGQAADEQRRADNPYLDEVRRLETEGRGTTSLRTSNPFKALVEFAEPVIGTAAGTLAGGAAGSMLGGIPGALAGAALGGGATGALYGRGEAIERVANDPNLSEQQKLDSIESTANLATLVGGGLGAITVGPAQLGRMGLRALAVQRGTQAALDSGATALPQVARAFAIKDVTDAAAKQSLKAVVGKELAANAVDAAALNAAYTLGSNAAYNYGTNQDLPVGEGLTEALVSGGALGALMGLPGARGIWRRRNQYGGQAFQTRREQQDLQNAAVFTEPQQGGDGVPLWQLEASSSTEPTASPTPSASTGVPPVSNLDKLRQDIKAATSKTRLQKVLEDHYAANGTRDDVLRVFDDLNISDELNKKGSPKAWKRRVEEDVNRTRASNSGGNEQSADVDQPGPTGARGANQPDNNVDSPGAADTPPVVESSANPSPERFGTDNPTVEERGSVGTESLDSGKVATDEAVIGEQGIIGSDGADGKPGDSPAAEGVTAADTGQRSSELEASPGTGGDGDATTAGISKSVEPTPENEIPTRADMDADDATDDLFYARLRDPELRVEKAAEIKQELMQQRVRSKTQSSISNMRGQLELLDAESLTDGPHALFPDGDPDTARAALTSMFIRDAAHRLNKEYAKALSGQEKALLKRARSAGVIPPEISREYAAQIAEDLKNRQSNMTVAQYLTTSAEDAAQIVQRDNPIC